MECTEGQTDWCVPLPRNIRHPYSIRVVAEDAAFFLMKYGLQHLSLLDVKMMLQARGQSVEGEPPELLEKLEQMLDGTTPFTWQLRQLPRRGPTPYRSGGSLVFHGDRLYLYGGFDENFHLHNDFWGGRIIGDQVTSLLTLSERQTDGDMVVGLLARDQCWQHQLGTTAA